jgi:putative flippase GtrA
MRLAITYALLALVATLLNIGAQDITHHLYQGPYSLPACVAVGTGVGLIAKYMLDKRYIFRFRARDAAHDGKTFVLYAVMGLATTVIFWGFEFGFDWLFGNRPMRYVGAVLGLAIGYVVKYRLDKRFVFR